MQAPADKSLDSAEVLIVDDDATILSLLESLFEMEGFCVRTSSDGAEALEQVKREVPSVILLDLRMPVMDGWEFLERLRRTPQGSTVPVLLMSAYQKPDRAKWAHLAQGFIQKPFDVDQLVTAAKNLVQSAAA